MVRLGVTLVILQVTTAILIDSDAGYTINAILVTLVIPSAPDWWPRVRWRGGDGQGDVGLE